MQLQKNVAGPAKTSQIQKDEYHVFSQRQNLDYIEDKKGEGALFS